MTAALQGREAGMTNDGTTSVEAYLEEFRDGFRRRDQARWGAVYIRGLLSASGRRNVENLARAASQGEVEDVAQALGHFVNHSPWDEGLLWQRHAQRVARRNSEGVFVLEELALAKQGRHSVGVHRQFSRAMGRKLNCQLAVLLHHVGPAGQVPLWVRLYLPRAWLREQDRLEAAGVPEAARQGASRTAIAIELLDLAREAGLRAPAVVPGPGWQLNEELQAAAAERGMECRESLPEEWSAYLEAGRRRLEELGLGHFEGRSWRGFHHHACLVTLAGGFRPGE